MVHSNGTITSTTILKARLADDIRKSSLHHANDLTLIDLVSNVQRIFSLPSDANFLLKYKDEDGDLVSLTSDRDLRLALTTVGAKLDITVVKDSTAHASKKKIESSSDDSSDDGKKTVAKPTPKATPVAAKKGESSSDDSSDDESSLYASAVFYSEVSHRNPKLVSIMFDEATRTRLDSFLKENEAPKLEDIVNDNVFKKRKRTSTSGSEPPSKKVAAKESSSSDSSDDEAVKNTGTQKPVNVAAKKAAIKSQNKQSSSSSASDSDTPAKKWTPARKPAQTPAQRKAASSSDSDSDDEDTKKVPAIAQKAASGKGPAPVAKKQDTSDSDSDSEDSENGRKKANPVKVVPIVIRPIVSKTKTETSSDDSSDDEKKPAAKPTPKTAPVAAKKKVESSSDDSSDEKNKPIAKPKPKVTIVAAKKKAESSSDDSSDDEKKPAATTEKSVYESRKPPPFRRVQLTKDNVAEKFRNNQHDSSFDQWGHRANESLSKFKGKCFRDLKARNKNGSYEGGPINQNINSIKFSDSE